MFVSLRGPRSGTGIPGSIGILYVIVALGCDGSGTVTAADPRASCANATLDAAETDVDCGGDVCDPCDLGQRCVADRDCFGASSCVASGVCGPSCDDRVQNRDESDVDCGGQHCLACELGRACTLDSDCDTSANLACVAGACSDPCVDGVLTLDAAGGSLAGETDADCGGPVCGPCALGASCLGTSDCEAGLICDGGTRTCVEVCSDGRVTYDENQLSAADETAADCGGPVCPPCGLGQPCLLTRDCTSGSICIGQGLTAQRCIDPCTDGRVSVDTEQNNRMNETDIDCGGSCPPCAPGAQCVVSADCASSTICSGNSENFEKCIDPCSDDLITLDEAQLNAVGETDIDCGGSSCAGCRAGEACVAPGDCALGFACVVVATTNANTCVEPCTDGVVTIDVAQNNFVGETDADCGGGCAACAAGRSCLVPEDCESGLCTGGVCALSALPMTALELCTKRYVATALRDDYQCRSRSSKTAADFPEPMARRVCLAGTAEYRWAEDLLASVNAGRVAVDWLAGRECTESAGLLRTADSGVGLITSTAWSDLKATDCASFVTGLVDTDGACRFDWDCMNAGEFCLSTDNFTATRCMAPAPAPGVGYVGRGGVVCAPGFYSIDTRDCFARLADGAACTSNVQCTTIYCKAAVCTPKVLTGQPCTTEADCNLNACELCREPALGQGRLCLPAGLEGEYCAGLADCARDLDCQANTCVIRLLGESCPFPGLRNVCEDGADCVANTQVCRQYDGNAVACGSRPATCTFNGLGPGGRCYRTEGICAQLLLAGACAAAEWCAPGLYCANGFCSAEISVNGTTCSGDNACAAGLGCVSASCTPICLRSQVCTSTEYCAPVSGGTYGTCEIAPTGDCTVDVECGDDAFCATVAEICSLYEADVTACDLDDNCFYDGTNGCVPVVDAGCAAMIEADCDLSSACRWDTAMCQAMQSTCLPLSEIGELCFGRVSACNGEFCDVAPDGKTRCSVYENDTPFAETPEHGCGRNFASVQLAFMFGAVWLVRRRKRGSA